MSQDENNISGAFYIGWMSAAPKLFSRFIRKYLLIILPLIILLANMVLWVSWLTLKQIKISL